MEKKTFLLVVFLLSVSAHFKAWAGDGNKDWGVYSQQQQRVMSGSEVAKLKAIEAAVKKAEVPPSSNEAAMIRIGMGARPDVAHQPNNCCFNQGGRALNDRDVAERLAVQEAMRRGGIAPGSPEEEQLRAAAEGRVQTAEGEEVNEATVEEMAKEVAKQQAGMYSGAQSGSSEEAMIDLGVDTMWEKMKGWFD